MDVWFLSGFSEPCAAELQTLRGRSLGTHERKLEFLLFLSLSIALPNRSNQQKVFPRMNKQSYSTDLKKKECPYKYILLFSKKKKKKEKIPSDQRKKKMNKGTLCFFSTEMFAVGFLLLMERSYSSVANVFLGNTFKGIGP